MSELDEFEDWYGDLRRRLIVAMQALGATPDAADEIADEALLKAYERWAEVSQMANPAGWAYVVARNELRARARRGDVAKKLATMRTDTARRDEPVMADFDAMIAALPPRRRHVVILRYVFNLTEPEIAQTLGVPRGTVSSRLRSSHAQLRRQLTDHPT